MDYIHVCICSYLQVFTFSYSRNKGELLIERDIPVAFTVGVSIRKDIVLIQRPHEFELILINWKTEDAVVVNFSTSTVSVP